RDEAARRNLPHPRPHPARGPRSIPRRPRTDLRRGTAEPEPRAPDGHPRRARRAHRARRVGNLARALRHRRRDGRPPRDRLDRPPPPGGARMTVALGRREIGDPLSSLASRAVAAVAVVAAVGVASQPTNRAFSPVGIVALALAAIPFVVRDFRGRAAALPAVPLLLMYALADAAWHPPMSFVLEGVIAGLLTSLLAAGIVIVYRATRIVHFAQAELGA